MSKCKSACVFVTCFNQNPCCHFCQMCCVFPTKRPTFNQQNIIGVPPSYLLIELLEFSDSFFFMPYEESQPENYHGFVEMGPRPVEGDGTTACPTWRCWEILIRSGDLGSTKTHFENKHFETKFCKETKKSKKEMLVGLASTCLG